MKRMHIHVGVGNLDQSIDFYNALFGAQPVKTKADYAKWMLDDPCINFAISTRVGTTGVDHLGLQVSEDSELAELRERFKNADMAVYDEGETVCCYARSDKSWVKDPSGVAWEAYQSMQDVQLYSGVTATDSAESGTPDAEIPKACCVPSEMKTGACC